MLLQRGVEALALPLGTRGVDTGTKVMGYKYKTFNGVCYCGFVFLPGRRCTTR